MIGGNILVQTNQMLQNGIRQKVLNEGSQVLVRIISDKGNGRYEGSVAGARVSISSQKVLVPGSSFPGTVSIRNGQIYVTPKADTPGLEMNQMEMVVIQNEKLAAFAKAIGLPSDEVSFHLLQQMKQLEMKLDPGLFKKIRNLAVRFQGKEKKAVELLMILNKKGINFSEEQLLALLQELDWENKNSENTDDFQLLNQINKERLHWQLLPYEITEGGENQIATGSLKFLFNRQNQLQLLNIDCSFVKSGNEYIFSLEYKDGKCVSIKMNTSRPDGEALCNLLKNQLVSRGYLMSVELINKEFIEGTACGSEDFYAFGGEL